MKTNHIVWNSKSVEETINKLRQGSDVDLGCFHDRNPELKGSNILFQLTHEEEEEFIKCSSDIVYFVEKYCRFLTDKGRTTVELRVFQKDILNTLGDEYWLDEIDDVAPSIRNFILMASRQSGKCLLYNNKIIIKNTLTKSLYEITIGELFELLDRKDKKFIKKLLSKIKKKLFKFYEYIDKKI